MRNGLCADFFPFSLPEIGMKRETSFFAVLVRFYVFPFVFFASVAAIYVCVRRYCFYYTSTIVLIACIVINRLLCSFAVISLFSLCTCLLFSFIGFLVESNIETICGCFSTTIILPYLHAAVIDIIEHYPSGWVTSTFIVFSIACTSIEGECYDKHLSNQYFVAYCSS